MMSKVKTNAIRILDKHKISYELMTYEAAEAIDGVSVANKIGRDPEEVFKTLVTRGNSKEIYVFVIPVAKELDLKKAAKVVKEKKIEMIAVSEINKLTDIFGGGCSPVGMKKNYQTSFMKVQRPFFIYCEWRRLDYRWNSIHKIYQRLFQSCLIQLLWRNHRMGGLFGLP